MVLWLTGLSGSGKTALADLLHKYLSGKGLSVDHLDGDMLRSLFPNTGFSKEERNRHVQRAGELAAKLEKDGKIVIASLISPYRDSRLYVRSICSQFVEIYVKASLQTCEARDPKELYKKARNGEIKNFTGIDDPYEEPEQPEIIIDTNHQTLEQSFDTLKKFVERRLYQSEKR
ncbi:MAG: adenylyl-sulfate kinase [Bacteroidota bacterium]